MKNTLKLNTILLFILIILVGFGIFRTYPPKQKVEVADTQSEIQVIPIDGTGSQNNEETQWQLYRLSSDSFLYPSDWIVSSSPIVNNYKTITDRNSGIRKGDFQFVLIPPQGQPEDVIMVGDDPASCSSIDNLYNIAYTAKGCYKKIPMYTNSHDPLVLAVFSQMLNLALK